MVSSDEANLLTPSYLQIVKSFAPSEFHEERKCPKKVSKTLRSAKSPMVSCEVGYYTKVSSKSGMNGRSRSQIIVYAKWVARMGIRRHNSCQMYGECWMDIAELCVVLGVGTTELVKVALYRQIWSISNEKMGNKC